MLKINKGSGILILVLAAALMLPGCEGVKEYVDSAVDTTFDVFDMAGGEEKSGSITISKDNDSTVAPVIVVNDDTSAVITVSDNTGEAGEQEVAEVVEEDVWDDVNKVYSMHAASPDQMTLAFTGDICFHDGYSNMSALRERSGGIYDCVLPAVMDGIKAADILMVNNEFPYSNRGTPTEGKKYAFRSKPENVNILHEMGVDIVSRHPSIPPTRRRSWPGTKAP